VYEYDPDLSTRDIHNGDGFGEAMNVSVRHGVSIALVRRGNEMTKKNYIILAFSSAVCLVVGLYIGYNYINWIYFNDDESVRKSIYIDAMNSIASASPGDQRIILREKLESMHPDFFRSREYICVRFMPAYGEYGFVWVYCRNVTDGSVRTSTY
jgi:hypothetical protein